MRRLALIAPLLLLAVTSVHAPGNERVHRIAERPVGHPARIPVAGVAGVDLLVRRDAFVQGPRRRLVGDLVGIPGTFVFVHRFRFVRGLGRWLAHRIDRPRHRARFLLLVLRARGVAQREVALGVDAAIDRDVLRGDALCGGEQHAAERGREDTETGAVGTHGRILRASRAQ